MKNVNLKSLFKTFVAVAAISTVFAACSKDKYEPQQVAGLSVIDAAPDTVSLDFYIDRTRVNNNRALKFNDKIDYLNLFPGTRTLSIAKRNGSTALTHQNFNLASGVGYSIFILDTIQTNEKRFLLTQDDLSAPAADKAKVRFINLYNNPTSATGAGLGLGIEGKEDLFPAKTFYQHTDFTAIDPGESITFNIKSGDAVETTLPNVKIEKGKIYTIYAKGNPAAAIDSLKLGAAIYTHK